MEEKKNKSLSSHMAKAVLLALAVFGGWLVYNGFGLDYSGLWIGETRNLEGARVAVAYRIERRGIVGDYYVTNDTYSLPSMQTHHLEVGAIIRDRWVLLHCMAEAQGEMEGDVLTVAYSIIPLILLMNPENPNEVQCSSTIFHNALTLKRGSPAELEDIKKSIAEERKEALQKEFAGLTYSVSD